MSCGVFMSKVKLLILKNFELLLYVKQVCLFLPVVGEGCVSSGFPDSIYSGSFFYVVGIEGV